MLGINPVKAVLFVQHLAARAGFRGNGIGGIGISVLEYRSAAWCTYCVKEVSQ